MSLFPDERLRRLLREWQEVPSPDAALAERVRREVATRRSDSFWQALSAWSLPRIAAASVLIGVLLGLLFGEIRVAQTRTTARREMPVRYLEWIDPAQAPSLEEKP